ncbi:MAG: hypothetical protein HGA44_16560 [Cellulomonadaceae bacterium]|nr:hypothetical protein [Cellulomonadaceae bacterium]
MDAVDPTDRTSPASSGPRDPADDAGVARLAATDPATGAAPDAVTLRAAVDERIAADRPDALAAARSRRWTAWPARVAGVAAALLVVGGGGYAVGAARDGGSTDGPAAAVITLGTASGDQGGASSSLAAPETAGAAADSSVRSSDMAFGGWYGHTVFTSSGLSDAGGTATAWALDPSQVFGEQAVTAAAAALGVAGTPTLTDGYWVVGSTDGTAPTVTLSPDGTASLGYYDPTKDPWTCATVAPDASTDAGATDPCTQRDLGPAPQGDAASAALRDVLTAIGVDPAGYEIVVESYGDTAWTYVTAFQVIDGQRSGLAWSAAFTGAGLQSLNGGLAPTVELGAYDVISPSAAVDRLGDARFGSSYGGPILYAEGARSAVATDSGVASDDVAAPVEPSTPTVPPTVAPGSALRWPVQEITIVSARLGVALSTQPDGASVLVPTYELTGDDGSVWSVVAVVDDRLDFSPAG